MKDTNQDKINYDGYIYAENCVFGKQELKERLEKQFGDFGEQLVMTMLGRIARYSVALVDHEGADLIASDKRGHEYAISVKSYQIGPTENETKVFKTVDQEKLCEFADNFDLIPAVAMIMIPKDFAFIDMYLMTLAGFQYLATDKDTAVKNAITKVDKGLQINNYSLGTGKNPHHSDKYGYLNYLHNHEYIKHIRLDVHNRSDFFEKDLKPYEKVHMKLTEKDGNLSRQLGDFGEYFLLMLLGQLKKYKVARVDHVGADLIACDSDGNKYAISVKTSRKEKYTFYENYTSEKQRSPKNELSKLEDFAHKYKDMKPVVAMVFIGKTFNKLDVYIAGLDTWLDIAFSKKYEGIQYKEELQFLHNGQPLVLEKWKEQLSTLTININDKKKKRKMDAEERIEHMEMTFDSWLDPNKKW